MGSEYGNQAVTIAEQIHEALTAQHGRPGAIELGPAEWLALDEWVKHQSGMSVDFPPMEGRPRFYGLPVVSVARSGIRIVTAKEFAERERCPHDTDGDGNCHLCAKRGRCFNRP